MFTKGKAETFQVGTAVKDKTMEKSPVEEVLAGLNERMDGWKDAAGGAETSATNEY